GPLTNCHPATKRLVLVAAGAADGLLAEVVAAEDFARNVGSRDGVTRHYLVSSGEVVGDLQGGLSGSRFGGKESFGNARNGGAGEKWADERRVDPGSDPASSNLGELFARFALAFDSCGEEGAVAAADH